MGPTSPKLRFSGFTDPWEQRKLGEVAKIERGLTYSPNDVIDGCSGVRVLRSSNIAEDALLLDDESDVFVRREAVGIPFANNGDILITAANGSSRLVGKRAKLHDLTGDTVHGGFMLLARTDDPDFLNASMGAGWYGRFLRYGVAGGNGALGNLDKAALEKCLAPFPPSENEQRTIGSFFSSVDELIALHQRKYGRLVQVKAALLSKMFPKPGENEPEVRFAGYHDPWEQRKLGEVATVVRGERFTASDYVSEDGIPCIHYGEIYTSYGSIATSTISQVRKELRPTLRFAEPGDIIVAGTSENVEDICKAVVWLGNTQVAYHDDSFAVSFNGDPVFLASYFQTGEFFSRKASAAHGVKVMRVSREALMSIMIPAPSLPEQRLIGAFFSKLDDLIALHQRKVQMLKALKRAFLDKMFV